MLQSEWFWIYKVGLKIYFHGKYCFDKRWMGDGKKVLFVLLVIYLLLALLKNGKILFVSDNVRKQFEPTEKWRAGNSVKGDG